MCACAVSVPKTQRPGVAHLARARPGRPTTTPGSEALRAVDMHAPWRLTISSNGDQQGVRAQRAPAATASLPARRSARRCRMLSAARALGRILALQSPSPPRIPRLAVLFVRDPYTPRARRDDPEFCYHCVHKDGLSQWTIADRLSAIFCCLTNLPPTLLGHVVNLNRVVFGMRGQGYSTSYGAGYSLHIHGCWRLVGHRVRDEVLR